MDVLGDDLYVLTEEFGEWEDKHDFRIHQSSGK